ncbi:hypothetical protein SAY87_027658 [Trapa incisa]|uniref:Uncharacterized protein n=1 Tax=Trapa incisa TaxID=236973 RepID=A0AAN7JMS6_9MYRT|nr:hypothetical protein SAY87_027658 [Trapa incisa]
MIKRKQRGQRKGRHSVLMTPSPFLASTSSFGAPLAFHQPPRGNSHGQQSLSCTQVRSPRRQGSDSQVAALRWGGIQNSKQENLIFSAMLPNFTLEFDTCPALQVKLWEHIALEPKYKALIAISPSSSINRRCGSCLIINGLIVTCWT